MSFHSTYPPTPAPSKPSYHSSLCSTRAGTKYAATANSLSHNNFLYIPRSIFERGIFSIWVKVRWLAITQNLGDTRGGLLN